MNADSDFIPKIVHVRPESPFTFNQNQRSRCFGITVHVHQNTQTQVFTPIEQSEIYVRAILRGISESVKNGFSFALLSYPMAVIGSALYYADIPLPPNSVTEQIFTKTEVVVASFTIPAGIGVSAAIYSFFPAVKRGVNEGFEKGPKAIDPLSPFYLT